MMITPLGSRLLALSALVALSGLVFGCSSPQANMSEKLRDGVLRYNDALRWNKFEKAVEYVPTADRSAALSDWRLDSDDNRILEYEIESVEQLDGNKAEITIKRQEMRRPSNIVTTRRTVQNWTYGEDKKWQIVGERKLVRRRR
ncbi:MAG: hypothetical protein ACI9WU_004486 [Myxococcota bacterium]|jgi:hypothetical protein